MIVEGNGQSIGSTVSYAIVVAGCGRLQLGVAYWATSVSLVKELLIDQTISGSRFSSGGLLAIEDFTFTVYEIVSIKLYIYVAGCTC